MNNLTEKEKRALKEVVAGLKKLYGDNLSRVILYGSKARGEATEDSDIDILVVLKGYKNWVEEFRKICDIVNKINYEYELLISFIVRQEEEFVNRNTPLMLNVRQEGVLL